MIAKASETALEHFTNDSNTSMPSSKKAKLMTADVASSTLPKPVFPPAPEFKFPMSVFADNFSNPTPKKQTPPPTPRKKTPGPESPFETQYKQTSAGSFNYHNSVYQVKELGAGSFSTVYILREHPNQICPGVDNSEIVIKVYHGIKMGFDSRRLNKYLDSALTNYKQVIDLQLPVATIYNAETARSDRAIIQEKVDADIDISNPAHMSQVKKFLDTSLESGILMDLQPANLKVRNGVVVLIDFLEELKDHNILTTFNLAMKAWVELFKEKGQSPEQIKAHIDQLTKGFDKLNPYFSDEWRKGLLNG